MCDWLYHLNVNTYEQKNNNHKTQFHMCFSCLIFYMHYFTIENHEFKRHCQYSFKQNMLWCQLSNQVQKTNTLLSFFLFLYRDICSHHFNIIFWGCSVHCSSRMDCWGVKVVFQHILWSLLHSWVPYRNWVFCLSCHTGGLLRLIRGERRRCAFPKLAIQNICISRFGVKRATLIRLHALV